jgi:hypothetical protein
MTAPPRHYWRNCRSKLKALVESDHRAFCCRGCYAQFYRKRCVVCERSIERTGAVTTLKETKAMLTVGKSFQGASWKTS